MGESGEGDLEGVSEAACAVETFGGKVHVRWDPEASVTGFGPVSYFIEFLKVGICQNKCVSVMHGALIRGTVLLSVCSGIAVAGTVKFC